VGFSQVAVANQTDSNQTASAQESATISTQSIGIVKDKPEKQPFVEIDGGFMVPYTTNLPGTEIKFTMLPIPGGKFTMGSPDDEDDRRDDEGPQFEVTIKPFWMGKYEVTWQEYKRYMKLYPEFQLLNRQGLRIVTPENEIDAVTAPSPLYKPTITFEAGDADEEPAASMSQFAAKQYTKWLSQTSSTFYRLPYECEWEYACRAGTKTAYYFGDDKDDLEDHAWYIENSDDARQEVGLLEPNPWGLYDMYGNVAEWVLDGYHEDGYTHVQQGDNVTTESAFRTPTEIYSRVVRGGSFELEPEDCRSAARIASDKEWKTEDPNIPKSPWWYTDMPGLGVGFRLVRPLESPQRWKPKTFSGKLIWRPLLKTGKTESQTKDSAPTPPLTPNCQRKLKKRKPKRQKKNRRTNSLQQNQPAPHSSLGMND
jgi:formylglycine-generating enzyme required for sulfatase activity